METISKDRSLSTIERATLGGFASYFDKAAAMLHKHYVSQGFWPEDKQSRNVGEMLALIHSEISEALEGHRKNRDDDHVPSFKSIEVELADAIIRIMDMAAGLNLRVADAFIAKQIYNLSRPRKHGKAY